MRLSYTKQADEAIRAAGRTAREMKHPYIGSEHLLLGLRREYSGVAGQILAKNGVEEEKILHLMDELIAPSGDVLDSVKPKERVPVLSLFWREARKRRSGFTAPR